jgi:rhodanese-related sulfurtransferase
VPATTNQPLDARGLPAGYPFKSDWEITPRRVKAMLDSSARTDFILLDCRRPEERQAASIEGSTHIPMSDLEQRLDELESDAGARTAPIVVYCHHGVRSMRVTGTLRAHGFTDVRSMAGGIDLWSADIDPRVPRY